MIQTCGKVPDHSEPNSCGVPFLTILHCFIGINVRKSLDVEPYQYVRTQSGCLVVLSFPEDRIEILRPRPFSFSARSCGNPALGKMIFCIDASHIFQTL
jgi:hypothetical protein